MIRNTLIATGLALAAVAAAAAPAAAQVNEVSFQGRLTDSSNNPITSNPLGGVTFAIYTQASGSTAVWSENQSVTPNSNGVFSVRLGSVTSFPAALDWTATNYFLGITVGSDSEMTPRYQFTSAGMALRARRLGGVDATSLNASVTHTALNTLTAGTSSNADLLHTHATFGQAVTFSSTAGFSGAVTFGAGVALPGSGITGAGSGSGLNADSLDSIDSLAFAQRGLAQTIGGAWTFSGANVFSAAPSFTAVGAPFSVTSNTLVSNLNADLLDGINSTAFAQLGLAQTITSTWTFSAAPAFTAAGAPFSVTSATLVANLNADLLDGIDSLAFGQLAGTNTWTAANTFSSGVTFNGTVNIATPTNWQLNSVAFTGTMAELNSLRNGSAVPLLHTHFGGSWVATNNGAPGLAVSNTGAGAGSHGLFGITSDAASNGVRGSNSNTGGAGNPVGIFGTAGHASGWGVVGSVAGTTAARGVVGLATGTTGTGIGVFGDTASATAGAAGGYFSNTGAGSSVALEVAGPIRLGTTASNTNPAFVTGTNLNTLTNGSNADALHVHAFSAITGTGGVALLAATQTFTGTNTFSSAPAFTAAGAPFTVSSSTVVSGLNADLLDGINSTAIAMLAGPQTLTGVHTFSGQPAFTNAAAAPFTVVNNSVVTNLNADFLDGISSAAFAQLAGTNTWTAANTFSGAVTLNGNLTVGAAGITTFSNTPAFANTAPFTVIATSTKVTNLDADELDGLDSLAFAQLAGTNTWTGANTFSGAVTLSGGATIAAATTLTVNGTLSVPGTGTATFANQPGFTNAAGAPFTVVNNSVVTNLNADFLDGLSGTQYGRLASASTWTATQTFSGNVVLPTGASTISGAGTGSGLDADLLDGINSTRFLLNDVTGSWGDGSLGATLTLGNSLGGADTISIPAGNTLSVAGGATFSGSPSFTIGLGTPPFTVTSSTLVANLNAAQLNGATGTQYLRNDVTGAWSVAAAAGTLTLGDAAAGNDTISVPSGNLVSIAGNFATAAASTVTFNGAPAFANAGAGQPFTVSSATSGTVTNLSADELDQLDSLAFGRLASTGTITATWTFSHATAATAPFAIAGNSLNVLVTGLNADLLDGLNSTAFAQLSGANTWTGAQTFGNSVSVSGANTFTVGTGATTLGGSLSVAGATTLSGTLVVGGASAFNNTATANGTFNVATATSWQLGGVAYTGSMANLNTLRNGSNADALHVHSNLGGFAVGSFLRSDAADTWAVTGGGTLTLGAASDTVAIGAAGALTLPTGALSISGAGAGSGLDADFLDGVNGNGYLRSNANDTVVGAILTIGGASTFDIQGTWQIGGTTVTASAALLNSVTNGSSVPSSVHNHFGSSWIASTVGAGLLVDNSHTAATAYGLHGISSGTGANGVRGTASGVGGASNFPVGVFGEQTNVALTAGTVGVGVRGEAAHRLAVGVWGHHRDQGGTGAAIGVYGTSSSSAGANEYGVQGDTSAGRGVFGNATTGGTGVYGASSSGSGGVFTTATGSYAVDATKTGLGTGGDFAGRFVNSGGSSGWGGGVWSEGRRPASGATSFLSGLRNFAYGNNSTSTNDVYTIWNETGNDFPANTRLYGIVNVMGGNSANAGELRGIDNEISWGGSLYSNATYGIHNSFSMAPARAATGSVHGYYGAISYSPSAANASIIYGVRQQISPGATVTGETYAGHFWNNGGGGGGAEIGVYGAVSGGPPTPTGIAGVFGYTSIVGGAGVWGDTTVNNGFGSYASHLGTGASVCTAFEADVLPPAASAASGNRYGYHIDITQVPSVAQTSWFYGVYSRIDGDGSANANGGPKYGASFQSFGTSSWNEIGTFTQGNNIGTGSATGCYGQAGGGSSGNRYGVYGTASGGASAWGVYASGNMHCTGTLSKGAGSFLIDHPLDPENRILRHSFVESDLMLNVYKGRARLSGGMATITLPAWFDAVNHPATRDVSLTCVNGWSPLYVDGEIVGNTFVVRTTAQGTPDQEFTWVAYGVRNDKYAREHPIVIEEAKGPTNGFEPGRSVHEEPSLMVQQREEAERRRLAEREGR